MGPKNFFAELKRRNVYKVAVAYAVVAWLLIQIATQVFPFFEIPNWAVRLVVLIIAIGFPIALVLAWAFELTPEGIKRTEDVVPNESIARRTGRKLDFLIIAVLLLVIGVLVYQRLHPERPTVTSTIPDKSIAVLPFENRSEDKANAYFADGIQDEILTRLSKITALKVISRTSTQKYKSAPDNLREIGKQLGVANLLEGSVQKVGNAVHVNVQLIRVATDEHLWAESYNRKLDDIFGVEGEVAKAIADTLKARLTGTEEKAIAVRSTENAEAYDEYLRGVAIDYSVFDLNKLSYAEKYFRRAVELDPAFALAWAQLAKVHSYLYYADFDTTPARREATRVAAETAMKLAPDAGEAYLALGYYQFHCERNLDAAAQAFENARQRLPNNSDALQGLGTIFSHQGRENEALSKITEALQLDPRDASLIRRLMVFQSFFRRFTEAHATAERAFEIAPDDSAVLANQADIYQAEGDLEKASQVLARLRKEQVFEKVNETCSQIRQLIYQRHYEAAISALGPILAQPQSSVGIRISEYYALLATAQRLNGDSEGAKNTCARGRDFLLTAIQKTGGTQGYVHAMLALMYAGLGEKESALKEGSVALALEGDDTVLTPAAQEILAQIEAQLGENDSALARLPQLLTARYHSWLYFVPLTPAHLRLDPMFDPLRNDPRFQKLCEEKKP